LLLQSPALKKHVARLKRRNAGRSRLVSRLKWPVVRASRVLLPKRTAVKWRRTSVLAIKLALEAARAVAEAKAAAAETTAAVKHERQAELLAIAEERDLEESMARERVEAERRKEEALLHAASVSASLLGGLAQVSAVQTAASQVHVVEIPDDVWQENREQLAQLND
jgi:hypothetical protein